MKTIGFVSYADPYHDRKAWSGTIYKLRESINNAGFSVLWIPVKPNKYLVKLLNLLFKILLGRDKKCTLTDVYFKLCAKSVDLTLINRCDFLFFPGGAQIANHLKLNIPYIFFGDSTFKIMKDYYIFGLPSFLIDSIEQSEKIAIQNSAINIRASKWAIDSVINDYGYDEQKAFVLEIGPNLDKNNIVSSTEYQGGTLNVLFSGVEWERKGAAIAIDTVRILNRKGVSAKLFLCGIPQDMIPHEYQNSPFVEYIGFLNKNNAMEYCQYIDIIKKSHLFLLPTKAECAGVVFSEASAYALPIFTYDTGGIPNYVVNGLNGFRLPLHSSAQEFATKILFVINNNLISQLRLGCIKMYKERLNWEVWSNSFRKIVDDNLCVL